MSNGRAKRVRTGLTAPAHFAKSRDTRKSIIESENYVYWQHLPAAAAATDTVP
jgi:hypothetical protein